MRAKRLLFAIAALATGLTIPTSKALAAEELKISGGVSAVTNIFSKVEKPFVQATGIKLIWTHKDPNGQGGDAVFKEVDDGTAEAGATGSTFPDWLSLMKDKKYVIQHESEMKYRVIGRDLIQFFSYKGGPKSLSEQQLKDLLAGKIKNWKEVGGEDKAVVIMISEKQPSSAKFLEQRFIIDRPIDRAAAKMVSGEIADYVKQIGSTPGAFGFAPKDLKSPAVNSIEHPPVGRPITMLWRGSPSKNLLKFMDFIASDGAKYGVTH